ncbi:MAG TPA: aldose 1-epimerase [Bryobacteraceae bacterium]|jgi:aldose 1-epimerase
MRHAALLLAFMVPVMAQNYKAEQTSDHGVAVVRLSDAAHGVEVSIVPSVGNTAYEMKVHGLNILHFPFADVAEFRAKPSLAGIPFLAPWGNRLDQQAFFANGKKYAFDMTLGNVRGTIPIHGLLSSSPYWQVTEAKADQKSAHVTSKLEFWKYPDLMKQWPFAHEYEMTYSLSDGQLEVRITVANLSAEPMPVAVGFHPYFKIPGVKRNDWVGRIPARQRVVTDARLIPTGQYRAMDLEDPFLLERRTLDDGFTDLMREPDGRARFYIVSAGKQVEVFFGPKYQAAVVWEPNDNRGQPQEFICFEPMAGVTNAVNLNHEGKYPELQWVAPGAKWTESFWVKASGI